MGLIRFSMFLRRTQSGTFFRTAAIFGLFIALFVSSGEGVRLFPIPVEGQVENEFVHHDSDAYCVGTQAGRNVTADQRTKYTGDLRIDTVGAIPYYVREDTLVTFSSLYLSEFSLQPTFRSDPPITSHSGRAPPIV